jgi:hypothetical protein
MAVQPLGLGSLPNNTNNTIHPDNTNNNTLKNTLEDNLEDNQCYG